MKNLFNRIDQKLLERYPTIWNTKVVWMLLAGTALHGFFFILGLFALTDPKSLQSYDALNSYFGSGSFFIGLIISILLITLWVVMMFRNNAFKNFYSYSAGQLFFQFCSYLVIIIYSISFYYSYTLGLQAYISTTYTDEIVEQDLLSANRGAQFVSQQLSDYTLDEATYPEVLSQLHAETRSNLIDYSKPHYQFANLNYQFSTVDSVITQRQERNLFYADTSATRIGSRDQDDLTIIYYKDQVQDVSDNLIVIAPSYWHYSSLFFEAGQQFNGDYNSFITNKPFDGFERKMMSSYHRSILSRNVELMKSGDRQAFQEMLTKYLDVAAKYKVETNLDASTWMDLVYNPDTFEVKALLQQSKPENVIEAYPVSYSNNSEFNKFSKSIETDYYINQINLRKVFENLEDIKTSNIFNGSIHAFIWISFGIGLLLFLFRISSLRILIFTIVAIGVVVLLLSFVIAFTSLINNALEEFSIYSLVIITLLGTILCGVFALSHFRKFVAGIIMNMTLIYIVPLLFFIALLIDEIRQARCIARTTIDIGNASCYPSFWGELEYLSYGVMLLSIIFIAFYCNKVLKWRALPES
ncbi:YrzE family protein [Nonlabens ponticola]|uniref:Uncharacterized protein n=1 Tax=Nonlabens ponticola TaxID=2496866 RepID=A0A3S9MVF0_9FLAO|nr:YrzE family protein [Nonlabens ponticola]AZQ43196.1 hypothetical protein EJ995_02710 [Nonlabens ponticola]